ncbi:MAG: helix-turn-helix domain-containing protein [Clostridium sp.]|nr:helix-turn-helix domain-containing protein [Clostridium sp.]MCM1173325.1 helix-turn-helix domain-containing protein [Clostridium sp.]
MEELDYKKIGLKMKEVRVSNHIRQDKIAKDLGCTIAFVSNVENNRAKLNLRMLAYYSKLCNTPMDVFIKAGYGKEVQADLRSDKEDELLYLFSEMTEAEQDGLLRALKAWKQP